MTILENIEKISQKVWITRKARIEASERLRKNDFYSQIFVNYYTLFVLGLSIWSLNLPAGTHKSVPLLTAIASVALFGLSIFVSSCNFKERYLILKDCYIQLENINVKIELLKSNYQAGITTIHYSDEIIQIQNEYVQTIKGVENHTPIDYLAALSNSGTTLSKEQHNQMLFHKLSQIFIMLSIIIAPLVLLYLVIIGVI